VSQSGRTLEYPWKIIIAIAGDDYNENEIKNIVMSELKLLTLITDDILSEKIQLF